MLDQRKILCFAESIGSKLAGKKYGSEKVELGYLALMTYEALKQLAEGSGQSVSVVVKTGIAILKYIWMR